MAALLVQIDADFLNGAPIALLTVASVASVQFAVGVARCQINLFHGFDLFNSLMFGWTDDDALQAIAGLDGSPRMPHSSGILSIILAILSVAKNE